MSKTDLSMQQGAAGLEALIGAVILRAVKDFKSNDVQLAGDAAAYFLGDVYREHLQFLGMSEDVYPVELLDYATGQSRPAE